MISPLRPSLQDDPAAAAKRLASEFSSLIDSLKQLQNDPALADDPTFIATLAKEVDTLQRDETMVASFKTILPSDLTDMYQEFSDNILNARNSNCSFLTAAEEAVKGSTSNLEAFLTSLTTQSNVLNGVFLPEAEAAKSEFQSYIPSGAQDNLVKDESEIMASKISALDDLLQALKRDPTLANQPIFTSTLANDVSWILKEYNIFRSNGSIPASELGAWSAIYTQFQTATMNKTMPGISPNFYTACQEALNGNPSDLQSFLTALASAPKLLQGMIDDNSKVVQSFENFPPALQIGETSLEESIMTNLIQQLNDLTSDLLIAKNIFTAEDWINEHQALLNMMAATMVKAYSDLQQLAQDDPSIKNDPVYKALAADFSTKTSPSLASAAAAAVAGNDVPLANVMALLANTGAPHFNISSLQDDINDFLNEYG